MNDAGMGSPPKHEAPGSQHQHLNDVYEIGWICALHTELAAARAMLDEDRGIAQFNAVGDSNTYAIGRIHQHNVVIACLPAGIDGTNAASTVAQNMMRTFPQIRIGLLVGIGGGIPNLAKGIDVRLGDVVVSQPDGEYGGVIQYAKGKWQGDESPAGYKFVRKGSLNKPPIFVLNALKMLQAEHETDDTRIPIYLTDMLNRKPKMKKTGYTFPGADQDHLFDSAIIETKPNSAGERGSTADYREISRSPRESSEPVIHYGNILSGDAVIKHAAIRDMLRDEFGAICVEMEAAGLMDTFPCLVVRGICDYADCFKNDVWHPYTAAVAAAYAKEFLLYISPQQMHQGQTAREVVDPKTHQLLDESVQVQERTLNHHHQMAERSKIQHEREQNQRCHQSFACIYEEYKDVNPERAPGTCKWVLNHPQFQAWQQSIRNDLLWISADPGCGKSVLTKSLIDHELRKTQQTVCYFFFKDNTQQDSLVVALKALVHQLFSQQPQLIIHARSVWEQKGDKALYEVNELWRIFVNATSDPMANLTYCILDALDECREDDRRTLITSISKYYQETTSQASNGILKILVTSRPYASVERWFNRVVSELPQIRLRGEDENDQIHNEINLVISQRVEELTKNFMLSKVSQDWLENRLLQMENRTYLWLHLAMDEIRSAYQNSFDPEDVQIDSVPASVDDAYERILRRISPKAKSNARKVLMIIIGAQRPLTIGEMALALASSRMYDEGSPSLQAPNTARLELQIREWCGLFVFINHSKLFLIHQTAKEFLLAQRVSSRFGGNVWKSSFAMSEVRKELVKLCVQHLHAYPSNETSSEIVAPREVITEIPISKSQTPTEVDRHDFFIFCAQNWVSYLDDQSVTENKSLLDRILHVCDARGAVFSRWFPVMWHESRLWVNREAPKIAEQHFFALIGHLALLKEISNREGFYIDTRDSEGNTALVWASARGHASVVEYLLDIGAEVDTQGGSFGSALHAAAAHGYKDVLQILLDRKANVNIRDDCYQTPLFIAAHENQCEVAQLLIEEDDIDINIPDENGLTPLMAASQLKENEVASLLLNTGDCNVNSKSRLGQTALSLAVESGDLQIVKLLLACNDIDANLEDENSQTPLSLAISRGDQALVKLLLSHKGINVNWKDRDDRTCLSHASERGQNRLVKLLLEHSSIKTESKEENGVTVIRGLSGTLDTAKMVESTEDRTLEKSGQNRTKPPNLDSNNFKGNVDHSTSQMASSNIDLDAIINKLLNVRRTTKGSRTSLVQLRAREIDYLCTKSREIFLSESSLLELEAPLQICGDLRARYKTLLQIFDFCGHPPDTKYLFLGNYVDRGPQSLETMCLLFALKIKHPDRIFLLRGNHECASINRIYGFYDECKRRYSVKLWKRFTDCHNCLPLAAIIEEKIFAVHAGLSPDLDTLDQIRQIHRPTDVPDVGLICDLLWSSPAVDTVGWTESDKGVSFSYGSDVVSRFVQKHDLNLICRANSIVENGHEFFSNRQLVTLFSLPNYLGEFDTSGAVMKVDEDLTCSFQILRPQARLLR